jgi:serine protease Do
MLRLLTAAIGLALVVGFANANEPRQEKKEKAKKGWLGVSIQDVTEKIAKKNNLSAEEGAYINDVVDNSPADSAGLKEGDVIVKFADRDIYDSDDLVRTVSRISPGTRATVTFLRGGERKSLTVVVGKEKTRRMVGFGVGSLPRLSFFGGNTLGMRLSNLNEQLGEYFGAPDKHGVLVEEVDDESAAAKAGFKAGDVITRAGKRSVEDVEDVNKELRKHDEGDKVEFEILRKGTKKTLTAEIEEEEEGQHFNVAPKMRMNIHPNIQIFRSPRHSSQFEFDFDNDAPWREVQRFKIDGERIREEIQKNKRSLEGNLRRMIRIAPHPNEL